MIQTEKLAVSGNCNVCSFDVFDTLLFRRSGMPETVFGLMEAQWASRFGQEAPRGFGKFRAEAEACAQRRLGRDTVTIEEIYEVVRDDTGPDGPHDKSLIEFELELEKSVLAPVPGAKELVGAARASGKQIVFTSDTYLPGAFLSGLLRDAGFMKDEDKLYASVERGASKAVSGELFRVVQGDLGCPASACLHIGNSKLVDVMRPRENGWQAEHFDTAEWTRREWLLWHLARTNRGLSLKAHAAARNARLNVPVNGVAEETACTIGAATAGPILVAFSCWVLKQARAQDLEELFFLSRDAQVVFEICRIVSQQSGARCPKLTYVYGSRQVWAFYALHSLPENQQAQFFADKLSFSANSLEECAGILDLASNAEVRKLVARNGTRSSAVPHRDERVRFYQCLLQDPALAEILRSKLAKRSDAYMDYLTGLAMAPGRSCGVVDIGWSGMWTEIVGAMFRDIGARRVVGFQMGRFRKPHPTWDIPVDCFLFDQTRQDDFAAPGWLVPLLEIFCGADHGRVTGIDAASGRSVPIESARKFGGMPEQVFRSFRSGVCSFAREWVELAGDSGDVIGDQSSLIEILQQFWLFPNAAEARFVQGVDVGMSLTADSDRTLVRSYRPGDLMRLVLTTHLPGFEPHWWHRGALALTAMPLAGLMAATHGVICISKRVCKGKLPRFSELKQSTAREKLKFIKWLFQAQNG
jgi:FMN phosphatase YigB (HAD superfamily)